LSTRTPSQPKRLGDRGEARVLEVHAEEAVAVEVDVVLLLGAPLLVVEEAHGDADLFTRAGQQLVERDAPCAIADIGERRTVRRGELAADHRRERVAAIAEHHRTEHRARLLEFQVAVGDLADVADVGRHHRVVGHRLLQLAQHLPRMHVVGALRHVLAPRVGLGIPRLQLHRPCVLRGLDARVALGLVRLHASFISFSRAISAERTSRASPQIVMSVFLTRPSTFASASTWISFASFGQ
jgi:hypothetical protein